MSRKNAQYADSDSFKSLIFDYLAEVRTMMKIEKRIGLKEGRGSTCP